MSSQLKNLQSALQAYGKSTEQQASGLDPIVKACQQSSQQILSLIGGSSTGKDAQVQAAVDQAQQAIKQAAEALRRASNVAKSYANSL